MGGSITRDTITSHLLRPRNGASLDKVGRHLCGILPSSFVSERNAVRLVSTAPRSAQVAGVFSSGVDGGGGGGGSILTGAQGCGVECSRLADKELFNAGTVSFLLPKNVNRAWKLEEF